MRRLSNGVQVFEGDEKKHFGGLLLHYGDGLSKHQMSSAKESVGAKTLRMCTKCNVRSKDRLVVYNFMDNECPLVLTTSESHERDLAIVAEDPTLSKYLGVSNVGEEDPNYSY